MSELVWQGFLRSDSRLGVRNLVLVIYTVECASHVALEIGRGEEDTHVIGFPGCYDNAYAIRLMLALARHPNVGAVLTVGLGCEYAQPARSPNWCGHRAGRRTGSTFRSRAARERRSNVARRPFGRCARTFARTRRGRR